ncbi:MAG: hypothetical protein AABZ11_01995 [Nitrospinota bacterium]
MTDKFAVICGSGAYELLKNEGFGVDLECRRIITPFGKGSAIHRFMCRNSAEEIASPSACNDIQQ